MNCPQTGAPRKISTRAISRIVRIVENDPKTTRNELVRTLHVAGVKLTRQTVGNALCKEGLRFCKPRKVPLLKRNHVQSHLKLANVKYKEDKGMMKPRMNMKKKTDA